MDTHPLVSVIVPAYDAATFLAETLRSIQTQTYSHLEVIVVDDGSGDGTYDIAASFARSDSRFRVVRHQRNAGLSAARNTGVLHATGTWIAFQDADDVWLPEKTARQIELTLLDPEANFLFTECAYWDGSRRLKNYYGKRDSTIEGNVHHLLLADNVFLVNTVMIRRDALDKAGEFDPALRSVEDWDLWLRVAENGIRARGVWEPLVLYRQWSGNMSNNRIIMLEYTLLVIDKALARPQKAEARRALESTRARHGEDLALRIEFSSVLPHLDDLPSGVAATIWRAWRRCPRRRHLLVWSLVVLWPRRLGGGKLSRIVHEKIRRHYGPT